MTTQQKLDDAKSKYHLLLTGQLARVYVDQNGERVEYTSANRAALKQYIAELEVLLGVVTQPLGPLRVVF